MAQTDCSEQASSQSSRTVERRPERVQTQEMYREILSRLGEDPDARRAAGDAGAR